MTDMTIPPHIERISKGDPEQRLNQALEHGYGERFTAYRESYQRSLDADREAYLPDFPITLGMELLNKCNFACVMCHTTRDKSPKITLPRATIERVLTECGREGLPALMFGIGEEPLLHKQFRDVFELAKTADVMDIFLFTNGMLLTEDLARFLIERQIARVFVSLDAATPETFRKIRGKDELERIERNIHTLVRLRDEQGSALPMVRVSFCVQPGNMAEKSAFIAKWQDVVDHIDFQMMHDFNDVGAMSAIDEEERNAAGPPADPALRCHQPWEKLTIWANGDVSPCCTFHGKNVIVGNVETESLKEIWQGDRINNIRAQLATGSLNPVCRVCLTKRDRDSFAAGGDDDNGQQRLAPGRIV